MMDEEVYIHFDVLDWDREEGVLLSHTDYYRVERFSIHLYDSKEVRISFEGVRESSIHVNIEVDIPEELFKQQVKRYIKEMIRRKLEKFKRRILAPYRYLENNVFLPLSNIMPKKCEECGEKIACKEHGKWYIRKLYDIFDLPVFYCGKCVEEYQTALGSIIHSHFADVFNYIQEHYDEIVEELRKMREGDGV